MRSFSEILSHHPAQALRPFTERSLAPHLKLLFSVFRNKSGLDFNFTLTGRVPNDLAQLVIPPLAEANVRRRRDELWNHTCLEIFVGDAASSTYVELNLSPSGDWNVYGFDGYRLGMRPLSDAHAPLARMEVAHSGDSMTWHAHLRASAASGPIEALLGARALVLGAASVLEYQTGEREYWALVHSGEKPDFHLRESFRLPL